MVNFAYTDILCTSVPTPYIKSNGIMDRSHKGDGHSSLLSFSLPLLQLQIALILGMNQLCYYIFGKHLGLPRLFCHLFAGVILGQSCLGGYHFMQILFPIEGQRTLDVMGSIGYALFIFLCAVKIDLKLVTRTGKRAIIAGVAVIAAPAAIGFLAYYLIIWCTKLLETEDKRSAFLYLTSMQSLTAFANIADLLGELKLLNSELGRLVLSAALIAEMCNTLLLTTTRLTQYAIKKSHAVLFKELGIYAGFLLFLAFLVRPTMYWIIKRTPQGRPVSDGYVYAIILLVFAIVNFTNYFGSFSVIALVFLGIIIPAGPPLGSSIVSKLESFSHGVLFPIFITTSGMRVNLLLMNHLTSFSMVSISMAVICLSAKVIATFIVAICCKMPTRDSAAFAALMSNKGAVEMAAYNLLRDQLVIGDSLFSVLAIWDGLNTILAARVAKFFYDPKRKYAGYQKRNIMSSRPDADFKIVGCIHRPDDVTALIHLLDAFSPTRESRIVADIIHLIELLGRATPVFISNKLQKRINSGRSYSGSIVRSFEQYQRDREDTVSADVITAISPTEYMHEDICYLALDKVASFIVLPFHQRWSMDGTVESDSNKIRALNCSVLDAAPCSVGILVDHGNLGQGINRPITNIAVVFKSGKDCREALSLAKRMAKNPEVQLTVVRFLFSRDEGSTSWENMLDSEAVKDIKESSGTNFSYVEEKVEDEPQITVVLRNIVDRYDLFVVGRHYAANSSQTNDLSELSDFPELGHIGDLLTSTEFNRKSSVLVVQQQALDNVE